MVSFARFAALCALAAVGIYQLKTYMNGPMCQADARLDGKIVIITGANTGIGKETVIDLALRGASIVMACRSLERCDKAAQHVLRSSNVHADKLVTRHLDLSSFSSIRKFANDYNKEYSRLDILINNAGVMWPPYTLTEDDYELTFAINHLGHFLLTHLLVPTLINSVPSRIVTVSSLGHLRADFDMKVIDVTNETYQPTVAYAFSKLSNVLFSKKMGELLKGTGVTTYSLHPGAIRTDLGRNIPYINNVIIGTMLYYATWPFLKEPTNGAQTQICCAVDPAFASSTSLYYSDCAEAPSSEEAKDEDNANVLWEASVKMTKLAQEEIHQILRTT